MCTCGGCRERTRRQQAPAVAVAAAMVQRWLATSRAQRRLQQLFLSRMPATVSRPAAVTGCVVCCASLLQQVSWWCAGALCLKECFAVLPAADLADARPGYQLLRLPILPQGDCKADAAVLIAMAAAAASPLLACWLGFVFTASTQLKVACSGSQQCPCSAQLLLTGPALSPGCERIGLQIRRRSCPWG